MLSSHSLIPKKLHYCRFGYAPKSKKFQSCLDSWKKYCPDYEIIERNETNFPLDVGPYAKHMYHAKEWGFFSDYARFWILYHQGGIYLDTDVEIVKNLDPFLHHHCFLGFQDVFEVNGAIIGAVPHHRFVKDVLDWYAHRSRSIVLPRLLTPLLRKKGLQYSAFHMIDDIAVYPKEFFYPFAYFEAFSPACITQDTYAIHWFESTRIPQVFVKIWFPLWFPLVKFFYRFLMLNSRWFSFYLYEILGVLKKGNIIKDRFLKLKDL